MYCGLFIGIIVIQIGVKIADAYYFKSVSLSISEDGLLKQLPALFFWMYLISFGKKIVQICFVNCDVAMLYYPFYREPKTILSGFFERFKKTLMYNSLPIAGAMLNIVVMALLFGEGFHFGFYLVVIMLLIALNLLFSFHELFIYYLLQPFTSDMNAINPIYKIVSGIFYFLCYIQIQIKPSGYLYLAIISIIAILYVLAGLIVIQKIGPKTFRVKQ